jgi:nucleotide-binding universal stress UspA family protein
MTVLAPYDGTDLSRTAARRATEFASYRDEEVVVLTVIPDDREFARDRGWIDEGEPYDPTAVEARFRADIEDIAPGATFRTERPAEPAAVAATTHDDVIRTIRTVATEIEPSILFIGSDNAGRVSAPPNSVGSPISTDADYDVHIVRTI